MPKLTIPNPKTRRWVVSHEGMTRGNLWATKNIDLNSDPGKIRLSARMSSVFDTDDDADMKLPMKFMRTDADNTDKWWAICQENGTTTIAGGGHMFKTTGVNPTSGWAQDAISGTPTQAVDDMEVFGKASSLDRLVIPTGDGDLAMLNAGTWTATWWTVTLAQTALATGYRTIVKRFNKVLLVGNSNFLHVIDANLAVSYKRLTFPDGFRVAWIQTTPDFAWIGLTYGKSRTTFFGEGVVVRWNGGTESYEQPLPVYDPATLSGVIWNGVPYTVNGKGQLLGFNGQAFEQVDALPVYYFNDAWDHRVSGSTDKLWTVLHNGMDVVNGKIHILLSGAMMGAAGSTTNVIQRTLRDMPGGIWVYDPKIGLYCKYTLGQFGTGTTNSDWGSKIYDRVGAIAATDDNGAHLLAGAMIYTDNATTAKSIIAYPDDAQTNKGQFVTSQIPASGARAFWKRVLAKFERMENSTDTIVVKAKMFQSKNWQYGELDTIRVSGTWVSTTSFTTTDTDFANAAVGDEVDIFVGRGAGSTVHISAISFSSPTYTVTIDEAIADVGTTGFQFHIDNWVKLGSVSNQNIQKRLFAIMRNSEWVQFKVELRGDITSPVISELEAEFEPLGI